MALLPVDAWSQPLFTEVAPSRGIGPYEMARGWAGGLAAADFDDDGDVDLFVPTAEGMPNQLYRNLGDGSFEEVADALGVASLSGHRNALWLDADGDDRLDLLVGGDCFLGPTPCTLASTILFYLQTEGGDFIDATLDSGLDGPEEIGREQLRSGFAAGDLDNDGDLDLYTSFWQGAARLYRGEGDGVFTDISAASGLGVVRDHHQAMMHDFDGDGWLDIYAAIDNGPNHLWINQGDGSFVDRAPTAGADNAWNDMGLALGDADNDGDLDIYITNVQQLTRHNLLLRNDSAPGSPGSLAFVRVDDAGVESGGWGWGTTFLDADNDGDLDLAATNGWPLGAYAEDESRYFSNVEPSSLTFAEESSAVGFDDTFIASALVTADFDRDGDLDLIQACNGLDPSEHRIRLLDNSLMGSAASGHWLIVRPRMGGKNTRGIGAVIRVRVQVDTQMRLITAGTSYQGQEPAEAVFGLGEVAVVERIEIDWPASGLRSVIAGVQTDQVVVVESDAIFADSFESGSLTAWAP